MSARGGGAAADAQTRAYAARTADIVRQLRGEICAPERPHGLPAVVVMMGLPGSGKTHLSRILRERLGAAHVASDHLRSRLFLAASYSEAENALVSGCIDGLLDELLGEGHRVILDATHLTARSRRAAEVTAAKHRVPVVHVHVVADEAATRERLARRRAARAAGDYSEADERVWARMASRAFEAPPGGHLEVFSGPDLDAQVERIVTAVEAACAAGS